MENIQNWSNQDKAEWIMEKAKITMKKIDFHNAEGRRAEHMQKEIIDILAEYFDDNWIDTAYIEEEAENYIDPVQQRGLEEEDIIYETNMNRRYDF